MDRVAEIRFPSFCLFDIFRVGEHRLHAGLFEDVINRDPVFPGRLHADIGHSIPGEPSGHTPDVAVGACKLPDIKDSGQGLIVRHAGAGHQDVLVDIDAPTAGTFDVGDRGGDYFCAVIKSGGFQFRGCVFTILSETVHCVVVKNCH